MLRNIFNKRNIMLVMATSIIMGSAYVWQDYRYPYDPSLPTIKELSKNKARYESNLFLDNSKASRVYHDKQTGKEYRYVKYIGRVIETKQN